MARDASGSSIPPRRRTGACGAIRPASQMLTSAGSEHRHEADPEQRDLRPEPGRQHVAAAERAVPHQVGDQVHGSAEQAEDHEQAQDPAADQQPATPGQVAPGDRREGRPIPAAVGAARAAAPPALVDRRDVLLRSLTLGALERPPLALRIGLGLATLKLFEELVEPAGHVPTMLPALRIAEQGRLRTAGSHTSSTSHRRRGAWRSGSADSPRQAGTHEAPRSVEDRAKATRTGARPHAGKGPDRLPIRQLPADMPPERAARWPDVAEPGTDGERSDASHAERAPAATRRPLTPTRWSRAASS